MYLKYSYNLFVVEMNNFIYFVQYNLKIKKVFFLLNLNYINVQMDHIKNIKFLEYV